MMEKSILENFHRQAFLNELIYTQFTISTLWQQKNVLDFTEKILRSDQALIYDYRYEEK